MRFEGRWENNKNQCCSADTIKGVVSCICAMTSGEGNIYIYQILSNQAPQFLKIIKITN